MADQFATPQDLASALQQDLDASTANLWLDATAAVIQAATGQRIIEVADDSITLMGTVEGWLSLPQRPVTAVTTVTLDGTALTAGTATGTYRRFGSRLWRDVGWAAYADAPSTVGVVYTHGYPAGHQGLQLARAFTLSLARAAYANPSGATREQIDDYAVAYAAATDAMTPTMRGALRRQYGRTAGVVAL